MPQEEKRREENANKEVPQPSESDKIWSDFADREHRNKVKWALIDRLFYLLVGFVCGFLIGNNL